MMFILIWRLWWVYTEGRATHNHMKCESRRQINHEASTNISMWELDNMLQSEECVRLLPLPLFLFKIKPQGLCSHLETVLQWTKPHGDIKRNNSEHGLMLSPLLLSQHSNILHFKFNLKCPVTEWWQHLSSYCESVTQCKKSIMLLWRPPPPPPPPSLLLLLLHLSFSFSSTVD